MLMKELPEFSVKFISYFTLLGTCSLIDSVILQDILYSKISQCFITG